MSEAVDLTLIDWEGITLEVNPEFTWMSYALFAQSAYHGGDTTVIEDLGQTLDFLQSLLTAESWKAYTDHAKKIKAPRDECLSVIGLVLEALTARPTVQPSDSSAGLPETSESSMADDSSKVLSRLEGRPDLQRQVDRAQTMQKQASLSVVG